VPEGGSGVDRGGERVGRGRGERRGQDRELRAGGAASKAAAVAGSALLLAGGVVVESSGNNGAGGVFGLGARTLVSGCVVLCFLCVV